MTRRVKASLRPRVLSGLVTLEVSYAWEKLSEIRGDPDFKALAETQYHEVTDGSGFQLSPDWAMYDHQERMGGWHAYIARSEGRMIGYLAFYILRHPHSAHIIASDDLFYVNPDDRNFVVANGLFDGFEAKAAELKATRLIVHEKIGFQQHRRDELVLNRMCDAVSLTRQEAEKLLAIVRGRETALSMFFKRRGFTPYEKRFVKVLS